MLITKCSSIAFSYVNVCKFFIPKEEAMAHWLDNESLFQSCRSGGYHTSPGPVLAILLPILITQEETRQLYHFCRGCHYMAILRLSKGLKVAYQKCMDEFVIKSPWKVATVDSKKKNFVMMNWKPGISIYYTKTFVYTSDHKYLNVKV